jgi:uncharacterized membrane protein YedE/YeeE
VEDFTPIASGVGGLLIGAAAITLMLFNGRIAGISSIFGGLIPGWNPRSGDWAWRLSFIVGLVVGGLAYQAYDPSAFALELDRSLPALAFAGVLVGFGTRMGGGCTSGHGVCGNSRLSKRSLIATATFIATGAITVAVINRVFGGTL